MSLRVTPLRQGEGIKYCTRSESESERAFESEGVDAKLSDLPMARLKVR